MDIGTSVIARLKNKAITTGKPFQLHLQLFCQEEFLRRVSLSKYANNLILKGGLLIYTISNYDSRATIDVDFLLRQMPTTIEKIKLVINEILNTSTGNEFITFESNGYEEITPLRKYKGVSFQLVGKIKNTRTPFNVDFGIGDVIIPNSEKRRIPVQLNDFDMPEINTYSLESTIAEKFDAILQRLEYTSRMKDYYDIHYIAHKYSFDGRLLQSAIFETIQNRGTYYNKGSLDNIISLVNNGDMQTKWRQFLKRIKMTSPEFSEAIKTLELFISPIWTAITENNEFFGKWDENTLSWNIVDIE